MLSMRFYVTYGVDWGVSTNADYPEPSYRDDDYYDLVEMIEATTEPDRTIIKAHAQGFSYAEIAKITGLTVGAVSMRLTRALRKLRKQYITK